jgi:SSS family solute:Na+ symporter
MGAFLNLLVFLVCTLGSDQMAIQRYLATRDLAAARRSLAVHMASELFMGVLLALVGLAVLGYYSAHPAGFGDANSLVASADELLPRFIIEVLPAGFSGLVIAAILSAAMSSLSSGMNSVSAVITTDFVPRVFPQQLNHAQRVRLARWCSVVIGITAVLLSTVVGHLAGNLFEISIRVVNLFTAPVFVLFFLALFVPSATAFSAVVATLVSVAVAVAVGLVGVLGLELLWTAPSALAAGIAAGIAASGFHPRR